MAIKTFTTGEVLTASDTNTYLANSGLVYVGAGTLSLTTSATNVTGVFSSTYKQYRVLLNVTARSTTSRVDWRFINGTTPTSTGYYWGAIGSDYASNAPVYGQRSNNDNQWFGQLVVGTDGFSTTTVDIFNANKTVATIYTGQIVDRQSGYSYAGGGVQIALTAFTGFQLFTNTGTATVEYQVYGYRDQ
jgi:hypothetical protein